MKSTSTNILATLFSLLLLGCQGSADLVEGEYTGNRCQNTSLNDTAEDWEELECGLGSIEDLKLSISIPYFGAPTYALSSSNGRIGEGKLDQLPKDEWYGEVTCAMDYEIFANGRTRTYLIEESLDLDGRLIQSPALSTYCMPYGSGWRRDGIYTVTLFEQNDERVVCGDEGGHCIEFRMEAPPSE